MDQLHHDGEHWYALYCQPGKELLASEALTRQLGLTTYLPEIMRRRRGRLERTPLFPCYFFVNVDLTREGTSRISATQGVIALVGYGTAPQPLEAGVIEALRARVDHLNAHGPPAGQLKAGATVRLSRGPLKGLEAVFLGPMGPGERVRVLIEFLGQPRTVELHADALEAGEAGPRRPPRRSRGVGRPIRQP